MSDLVTRLRAEWVLQADEHGETVQRRNPDGAEAADRIEYLEKRLEIVPGWSKSADGISCRDDTIKLQDTRIQALETSLAEAEGRVIADVVAWLRDGGGKDAADLRRLHANKRLSPAMTKEWETLIQTKSGIATALETGEWKK